MAKDKIRINGFRPTNLGVTRSYRDVPISYADMPSPQYIGVVVQVGTQLISGMADLIRIDDYANRRINQPGPYHDSPFFIVESKEISYYASWEAFMAEVRRDVSKLEAGGGLEGRLIDTVRAHLPKNRNYLASNVGPGRWDELSETLK
jgi:hypothetical protein